MMWGIIRKNSPEMPIKRNKMDMENGEEKRKGKELKNLTRNGHNSPSKSPHIF